MRMVRGFSEMLVSVDFKGKSVLDLGCGFGRWGHIIRSEVDNGGNEAFLVGCDVFRECFKKMGIHSPYDEMVVCDLRFLPFREKCADFVVACEVIEHMEKCDGADFLKDLDRIACEQVIVSTPYGFFEQGLIRENVFEVHRSGWLPENSLNQGYSVFCCGLGVDFEDYVRKLGLYQFFNWLLYLRRRIKWNGTMLFASKKLKR